MCAVARGGVKRARTKKVGPGGARTKRERKGRSTAPPSPARTACRTCPTSSRRASSCLSQLVCSPRTRTVRLPSCCPGEGAVYAESWLPFPSARTTPHIVQHKFRRACRAPVGGTGARTANIGLRCFTDRPPPPSPQRVAYVPPDDPSAPTCPRTPSAPPLTIRDRPTSHSLFALSLPISRFSTTLAFLPLLPIIASNTAINTTK